MSKSRVHIFIEWAIIGAVLVVVGLLGLWAYVSITATPLHEDAAKLSSVTHSVPAPEWAAAVEQGRQILRTSVVEKNLPGLSVAVGIRGQIVWAEGFGWADLDKQVPVAPETQFRIGTASTPLTSAGVGLLLENGQLNLDDKIQAYVPSFPEKGWPVTLRQLMGHVAGVRNDSGDEGPLMARHCERPVDALKYFADSSLLFEPGTEYRYSSYGWILMSAAVEAAAKEPFLAFMQKQVFEPLGMKDTRADSLTETIPNRAIPYFPRFAGDPKYGPDVMRDVDYSCYSGASVFLSTPSDLVRFAMAIHGGRLLKPETVKMLQTSQKLPSGEETGYGLGWDLENVTLSGKDTVVVGHDGDVLGGMAASFMTFPEQGISVALIANTSYVDTFSLAVRVAELFARK